MTKGGSLNIELPYFWLGAEADLARVSGSRADASSPTVSTKGFDPARDLTLAAEFISGDGASLNVEDCDRIARTLKSIRRGLKHMGVA